MDALLKHRLPSPASPLFLFPRWNQEKLGGVEHKDRSSQSLPSAGGTLFARLWTQLDVWWDRDFFNRYCDYY